MQEATNTLALADTLQRIAQAAQERLLTVPEIDAVLEAARVLETQRN
jgi:hypothetical protein